MGVLLGLNMAIRKKEYLIPNRWSSAEGRMGSLTHIFHIDLIIEKKGENSLDESLDGFYPSLCKPYGWAGTGWLRADKPTTKMCKRCEKIMSRILKQQDP